MFTAKLLVREMGGNSVILSIIDTLVGLYLLGYLYYASLPENSS